MSQQQQGPSKEGGAAADPVSGPSSALSTDLTIQTAPIDKSTLDTTAGTSQYAAAPADSNEPELDEFGLPVFRPVMTVYSDTESEDEGDEEPRQKQEDKDKETVVGEAEMGSVGSTEVKEAVVKDKNAPVITEELSTPPVAKLEVQKEPEEYDGLEKPLETANVKEIRPEEAAPSPAVADIVAPVAIPTTITTAVPTMETETTQPAEPSSSKEAEAAASAAANQDTNDDELPKYTATPGPTDLPTYQTNQEQKPTVSEWSHQQIVSKEKETKKTDFDDLEWQEMPSYAPFDIYDDDGKLVAKEHHSDDESDEEVTGGASKGYTRVQMDEDAKSTTSMDENTQHLFKETDDDDYNRNPLSQLEATKDLLTEGQRIAYVGLCRLALADMLASIYALNGVVKKSWAKKSVSIACEHMKMWSQIVMVRLYKHMDISPAEQIMIEQLSEHGVVAADLTPTLMKNARVKNPMAAEEETKPEEDVKSPRLSTTASRSESPSEAGSKANGKKSTEKRDSGDDGLYGDPPPPAYEEHMHDELPDVKVPSQLHDGKTLDIDIRWTILCDLFLVLVSDSVYDARSRVLLELVGKYLSISWIDICKFEKKVTDALEMQEGTAQNWNESDILEDRARRARNRRYAMMGLATLGGGLVIGLSAGLLAPVIGAGLAAGFTTFGITSTGAFLGGTGGAALITTTAAVTGSAIAGKAAGKRTQNVSVFEFRPLYNNKRVNLIVTISGWMTGNEDDVRLPFSTVDPIMGDIFSVSWEPEMMRSMGQTINILATEVLTQSLQQVLGSTVLMALMASLQLPLVLTKLSYLLDNPWSVSLDRAWASGLILADTLIQRNLGVRPITLVGFSLGARVIYSCLLELAKRNAHGLVQNVYMFGSPVVVTRDDWLAVSAVVRGRFVNGYCTNDWILGYLFRATSGGLGRVAGLAPVNDIPGLENVDCTDYVVGHMAYRTAIPSLLKKVGWEVVSEEFTEIEEADPDQHRERQTELISEIEAARKELQKEPTKRKWGMFGKNKDVAKKQDWEVYAEDKDKKEGEQPRKYDDYDDDGANAHMDRDKMADDNILFDVEAIRRELALQEVEEKERVEAGGEKGQILVTSDDTSRPPMAYTSVVGPGNDAGLTDQLNVAKKRPSTPSVKPTPATQAKSPAGSVRTSRNFSFGLFGRKNSNSTEKNSQQQSASAGVSRTGSVTDLGGGINGGSTPDLRRNSAQSKRLSNNSHLGVARGSSDQPRSPYHGYSYDDEFGDDDHAKDGRIQMTFEDSRWDYDDNKPPPPVPKKQPHLGEQKRAVSYWGQSSSSNASYGDASPNMGNEWASSAGGGSGTAGRGGGALPVLNKSTPGVPQRHSSLSYYTPAPGYQSTPANNSSSNTTGLGISSNGTGTNPATPQTNSKEKPLPNNPWQDDDDDFFGGGGGGMTMSFE